MPIPINETAASIDMTPRVFTTTTIVTSPTDNTETIIASLTVTGDLAVLAGVILLGYAAFTVGTNGTACNLRIRRTNAAGAVQVASGAINATAANLTERHIQGVDAGAYTVGQVYVLTLTVTAGSAASTVSACSLIALPV